MSRFISYLNSCNCRVSSSKEGLKETKKETKLVCKYNVTSISEPTALRTNYELNIFKSMEIDGVMLDELVTEYTFDSTGVHTVKYELYDETKLGNGAPTFYNSNLIEATIPSSVTTIGNNAFNGCSGLTSINISSSVTSIGTNAFVNCSSLTSVSIDSNAIVSSAYTLSTNMRNIFGNQVEEYIIGNSVTSIGSQAFALCGKLTNINIPSVVTNIGDAAFYDCTALTSCTFDENSQIATISTSTFNRCTSLTSIDIPNSVTNIGDAAFSSCTALTSVNIPSGVTNISYSAFYDCSSLTSVTVNAETPPTLGTVAFNDNASGRKIYVPSESVDIYKSANGWSEYADSIFPIE